MQKLIAFLQERALTHDNEAAFASANEDREILKWIDENIQPFPHGEDVAKPSCPAPS